VSRRRHTRGGRRQTGMALLLVVWLLALLAAIAAEFMSSARVRAFAERNKRDDLEGLALALAGLRSAEAFLDDDKITGLSLDADGQLQVHRKGVTDPVPASAKNVPLGDGAYSWRIGDEDGLVNINRATPAQLASLLQQCGMGPGSERDTVIDSILDWRDPKGPHHLNGAEEDYYRSLDPPYSCKDGPFDVVEELLLVRGVTPQLFSGGEVDGKKVPGLRDLVTTYSPENMKPNPSTAPKAVLDALSLQRPAQPLPASVDYAIIATGKPAGNAPSRSLRAVVQREAGASGGFDFTLVYYNDTYTHE
jgi:general secretion pathway protein K